MTLFNTGIHFGSLLGTPNSPMKPCILKPGEVIPPIAGEVFVSPSPDRATVTFANAQSGTRASVGTEEESANGSS